MKFSMKAVAASVLFAVAGGSQAAILNASFPNVDGELFISIFRDTASPMSMIIDTDISMLALQSGAVTGWTSTAAQTSAIQAFLGTADVGSFRFNAGGLTTQHDLDQPNSYDGLFITVRPDLDAGLYFGTTLAPQENMRAFITQINNAYADTSVVSGLTPGAAGYHNAPLWGSNVGGNFPSPNTETAVGTAAPLYNYLNVLPGNAWDANFDFQIGHQLMGFINIDGVTGVASYSAGVSEVPVPAAVWLLGSGLVGLVGVARRRKA